MPKRPRLDRPTVVAAAADLVDAQGLEALSLGQLAKTLGVRTPSLYNHVEGLPGLQRELALVSIRQMGRALAAATVGKAGQDALVALAQAMRDYIKRHPGLYQAGVRASGMQEEPNPEQQAAEEEVVRIALAVVASFGLAGDDAIHAVRGLRSLIHGFATLEVAGGFGLPLDCDQSFDRLLTMFVHGLEAQAQKQEEG